MRFFTTISEYEYGEMQVKENKSSKQFTLTQKHTIFNEEFYSIVRYLASENVDAYTVPEKDFYVYEICYMNDGYSCSEIYINENEDILNLLKNNIECFLHGKGNNILRDYFNN